MFLIVEPPDSCPVLSFLLGITKPTFHRFGCFIFCPPPVRSSPMHIGNSVESCLLNMQEKRLCTEIRIPPHVYLNMQQVMSVEIFKGKVTKKTDAHQLFQMESSKVDRVYDMLVRKGIAAP